MNLSPPDDWIIIGEDAVNSLAPNEADRPGRVADRAGCCWWRARVRATCTG